MKYIYIHMYVCTLYVCLCMYLYNYVMHVIAGYTAYSGSDTNKCKYAVFTRIFEHVLE